jgi:predicted RNA-binding Zn-ribbon protein involved in translation (DUF1610 family)
MAVETLLTCDACGFTAPVGSDAWESVEHPPVGRLTRCPECGSTDVHNRGRARGTGERRD